MKKEDKILDLILNLYELDGAIMDKESFLRHIFAKDSSPSSQQKDLMPCSEISGFGGYGIELI